MNVTRLLLTSLFLTSSGYSVSAQNPTNNYSYCSEVGLLENGKKYTVVLGGIARDYKVCLNQLDNHLTNLKIHIGDEIGTIPSSQRSRNASSCGYFHLPNGENMILTVAPDIGYASMCRLSNNN